MGIILEIYVRSSICRCSCATYILGIYNPFLKHSILNSRMSKIG